MNQKPLQTALLSNAVFSTLSGLAFAFFSTQVTDLIGVGVPLIYQVLGVALLGFAGIVTSTATRHPINAFWAMLISLADFSWVIGTFLLIILAPVTPIGTLTLLAIAGFVGVFGIMQIRGISQMYAVPNKPNTHRLCVAIDTPETADKMWAIIADLQSIQAYSPNLTEVILRDNAQPGVDAVRQCTNIRGETWGEHCKLFDEQHRQVAFEFLADEPGFPYPFGTIKGGWDVIARENESTVNIWFEVTPKHRLLQPFILAMMTRDLAHDFGEVIARMVAKAQGKAIPTKPSFGQYRINSQLAAC